MQNDRLMQRRRHLLIAGILLAVALPIVAIATYIAQRINHADKLEINIAYAPFAATVTIDDSKVKNNHKAWLTPGKHHVKAELDGFSAIEEDIEVDSFTQNIYGMLTANTPEGEELAKKYAADFYKIEEYASIESTNQAKREQSQFPIIKHLPINNSIFSIGYQFQDQGQELTVNISTTEPYLNSAIEKLKTLAETKSLAEYNIVIKSPDNQLANQAASNATTSPKEYLEQSYANIEADQLRVNEGLIVGDYYYTTITTGIAEHYNVVTYRVVIKRTSSGWKLCSTPNPILTIYNTPDVPLEILNAANAL